MFNKVLATKNCGTTALLGNCEFKVSPYETREYQRFVQEMAKHCRCWRDGPCDGVLAGGPCDNVQPVDPDEDQEDDE